MTLTAAKTDTNEWTWAGEIIVPREPHKVRITIHEYEHIKADNAAHSGLTDSTRLVFSESVPTTSGLPFCRFPVSAKPPIQALPR